MRVNAISNSQNFTALRIKDGSEKYLNTLSEDDLKTLRRAGEEMKEYYYTDLYITDEGMYIFDNILDRVYKCKNMPMPVETYEDRPRDKSYSALMQSLDPNRMYYVHLYCRTFNEAQNAKKRIDSLNGVAKVVEFTHQLETSIKLSVEDGLYSSFCERTSIRHQYQGNGKSDVESLMIDFKG